MRKCALSLLEASLAKEGVIERASALQRDRSINRALSNNTDPTHITRDVRWRFADAVKGLLEAVALRCALDVDRSVDSRWLPHHAQGVRRPEIGSFFWFVLVNACVALGIRGDWTCVAF